MGYLRTVSTQTFWQLTSKFASSLSTLLILSLVSHHYGPSLTGVFTLALTYLSFFNLLADFGFNAHLLPELVNDSGHQNWHKLLGLRITWSAVLVVLSILLIPLIPSNSSTLALSIIIGSLSIFGYGLFISSQALFQSRLRYDLSAFASALGSVVGLLVIWGLVHQSAPTPSLLLAATLGWVSTGLFSLGLAYHLTKKIKLIWSKDFITKTFWSAWPISLTLGFNLVYFRLDSFILTAFRSFSEVGLYNIAYSVFQSVLVLPTFIMNGLYPRLLQGAQDRLVKTFIYTGLIMAGLGVVFGGIVWLMSPFLIDLISGSGFQGSVESLRILVFGLPAFFVSAVTMWWLIYHRRYKTLALVYLIGLIVNGLLNIFFIPQYSYIASSWITVGSEYLILVLQGIILVGKL